MSSERQVSLFPFSSYWLWPVAISLLLSSCVVIQHYPVNKPFVYKTEINVSGTQTASEKQDWEMRLATQLDDSLKTRIISYAGLWKVLRKPVAFDTNNIQRSLQFMEGLLRAEGYFNSQIGHRFQIDTSEDQQRVTIKFQVSPGEQTRIDLIHYDMSNPVVQKVILQESGASALKKGSPYSIALISAEIDRLLGVLHNNGFYKMSRNDLYAEVDTVALELIDPDLDPFEQMQLLDSLRKLQRRPDINITFKQRPDEDTTNQLRYHFGQIRVFPDQSLLQDSTPVYKETVLGPYRFFSASNIFKLPFITENIYIKPGMLYREKDYFRTINNFNRLGAWQNVDVALSQRLDSIPLLDADIRLYPALKRNLKVDLEASRNIADYITTSQFFGLGLNFALANRNAFRQSIQTNTNARFGVEFGQNFIQTLQSNLSHSIFFPKLITPFHIKPPSVSGISNERSILSGNGAYTIRKEIYNVFSVNGSWGYEWTSRNWNYQFFPINIEYTKLEGKDSLNNLIKLIPSLRFAFNDGFVIGMIGAINRTWQTRNKTSYFKARVEESGALSGFYRELERNNLFRFIKADVEYKYLISHKHSALALRGFAGYGFVYGKKGDQDERVLPFFKAYFAGGPYSMRAWQVRRLGPGSSLLYDTANIRANDRFGNMQLEANVEFRFDLTTIAGIKVKSALFTDIGNIWGVEFKDAAATQKIPEASFSFSRLYKDIAVAGGTSLRLDFDFFLIRLDWAYKIKNPAFADKQSGWFHKLSLNQGQFQLGINYPF